MHLSNIIKLEDLEMFLKHDEIKKYSSGYFNKMAEWDALPDVPESLLSVAKIIPVKDGRKLYAFSDGEAYAIKFFDSLKFVAHTRTQNYSIASKKNHIYYPDIVLYLENGEIAVLEVKPLYNMEDIKNKSKFGYLKRWCSSHGFLFGMISVMNGEIYNNGFLREYPVSLKLSENIESTIEKNGFYTKDDFDSFIKNVGWVKHNIAELRIQVAAFVSQHENEYWMRSNTRSKDSKFNLYIGKRKYKTNK